MYTDIKSNKKKTTAEKLITITREGKARKMLSDSDARMPNCGTCDIPILGLFLLHYLSHSR